MNVVQKDLMEIDKIDQIDSDKLVKDSDKIVTEVETLIEINKEKDNDTNNIDKNNNQNTKSLYELLSSETKELIASIFIENFDIFTTVATNVLNYYRENKVIKNTDGANTIPVSSAYLYYLDMLLISFINQNKTFLSTIKTREEFLFNNLLNNFLLYTNNTFLQCRILKILDLTLNNETYKEYIPLIIENESLTNFITSSIKFEEIIDYTK